MEVEWLGNMALMGISYNLYNCKGTYIEVIQIEWVLMGITTDDNEII
jgi:hypothetical protein